MSKDGPEQNTAGALAEEIDLPKTVARAPVRQYDFVVEPKSQWRI
jgi:hypothetical protein